MPNQDEWPRYTDPRHPYSGSGSRYQNSYNSDEYHRGDGPFQFPWWAIVIGFVVWFPLGFLFVWLNSAMRRGQLGGFENTARKYTRRDINWNVNPVYEPSKPQDAPDKAGAAEETAEDNQTAAAKTAAAPRSRGGTGLITGLSITGVALLAVALLALPDALYWLPDALTRGGTYWAWLMEELMPSLVMFTGGVGCLFGAHTIRTSRRMRKKIDNIVGDSKNMRIADIAAAIPCSYDKCCKYLEQCIDDGVFGPDAYLDMRRRYLVVEGKAPEPEPKKSKRKQPEKEEEKDQYEKLLDELRAVNDAIPDEEMSDKIDRLEAVSAKIFEQAKTDPDKLPRMRKFMDYYLPTSLKLLQTYAELDAQGVEGANISESKRRIEETMDTLVHAFETQLDQLFQEDALDVSADIDVMENMLRADGLTGDTPFKL